MTVRNDVIGNFSAVSKGSLAVRRRDLESEGGFDEQELPNALFAADLCLKLLRRGLRIVLTPYADLMHTGANTVSSPTDTELGCFKKRWPRHFAADPFYNPNLSRRDGRFEIEIDRK
jgi:GT2 family glycosyltransferase